MSTSEAVTEKIRVRVESVFDPGRSDPSHESWFFVYTIRVSNEGEETVQLLNRHWIITDSEGKVEEIRGPGVVGQQPVLGPGESFEYSSGCPLTTSFGTMHGSYEMTRDDGSKFQVTIAPFALSEPYAIN